jgi:hypothetical protein
VSRVTNSQSLRDDPAAHLRSSILDHLAGLGANDVGAILTRVSATFSAATRDLSQNGNRFRVMCHMELAAAELECVSGGTKASSHQASGVMFLTFTVRLVAVKTV